MVVLSVELWDVGAARTDELLAVGGAGEGFAAFVDPVAVGVDAVGVGGGQGFGDAVVEGGLGGVGAHFFGGAVLTFG